MEYVAYVALALAALAFSWLEVDQETRNEIEKWGSGRYCPSCCAMRGFPSNRCWTLGCLDRTSL